MQGRGYTKVISTRGQVFYYRNRNIQEEKSKIAPFKTISSTISSIKNENLMGFG